MEARVGRTRTGVVGAGEEGMNICVLCTSLVLVDLHILIHVLLQMACEGCSISIL